MNRSDVVRAVSDRAGLSRDQADAALSALHEVTAEAVASGDDVRLPGFLNVQRVHRPARVGRHPRTGAAIDIPAGFSVKVTVGAGLRKAVTAQGNDNKSIE